MKTKSPPISVRLFDLVRFMRSELHQANLITDEEYAWLCMEAPLAQSPVGGSPSPRRLEDYDQLRIRMSEIEADKARLDWLMEMAQWHTPLSMVHGEVREYRFRTPCITPTIDVRKAIDAAVANPVGK